MTNRKWTLLIVITVLLLSAFAGVAVAYLMLP